MNDAHLHSGIGRPFITVKFAQSLDGRIATATGDSQWISGNEARILAHQLRSENDAILVGIGTVLADDPRLTVRLVGGKDPLRIVVDSKLRIPVTAKVLSNGSAAGTLIATTEAADSVRIAEIRDLGAQVAVLPSSAADLTVDLRVLLKELGSRGVASVLVEGGAGIITALLAQREVDRLIIAIAPRIIGSGVDAVGDLGIKRLQDAITFSSQRTQFLGEDIIFDGRIAR